MINVSNEFNLINSIISNLSSKVEEMEDTIKKNHDLIQYKLTTDILYGNIKNEEEVRNRLRLSDKEFPYKYIRLVITEINPEIFNQLSPEHREFISFKLVDLVNNYFFNKSHCINVNIPSNCIATIINLPERTYDLQYGLDQILQIIKDELSLNCNIALSVCEESLLSISSIYTDTMNYLKYSFIYGYGNIFRSSEIEQYEANSGNFGIDNLKHLETLLKSCKYDQLNHAIDKLTEDIKVNGYSYNYTQTILIQVVGLICKAIREQSASYDSGNINDIAGEFHKIFTLNGSVEWIHKLIEIYSQNINARNTQIDHEFLNKITGYIEANIDRQISLNTVADEFNISTGHLSRLFKEGSGVNFSDYIIDMKFKKAVDLLIQSRLEVSEIAERLGYLNLSYFSKLFKEKYGMTPVQFRKKNV